MKDEEIDQLGYDACAVEVCPKVDGWVVITGKEGDEFHPVAFFFDRARAEQYCELTYDDGAGNIEPVAFDSCAIEAVVMHDRIVCSNDYTLDSHAKLRKHIASRVRSLSTSLICDHCGEDAIVSETGLFRDGDGSSCMTCGFPGHVSADEDEAYWSISDGDNGETCNRPDCEECAGRDEGGHLRTTDERLTMTTYSIIKEASDLETALTKLEEKVEAFLREHGSPRQERAAWAAVERRARSEGAKTAKADVAVYEAFFREHGATIRSWLCPSNGENSSEDDAAIVACLTALDKLSASCPQSWEVRSDQGPAYRDGRAD